MFPKNLTKLATLTLSLAFGVFAAQADTLYVDDDNCPGPGSGAPGDPFCSIQAGIDASIDTDMVSVAPGTYNELIPK